MCDIGFFDYMKLAGKVDLHEQGSLSDARYAELQSARKMIGNFLKGTSYKVDIYDAKNPPKGTFVYTQIQDSVYIEAKDLLNDTVVSQEFYDRGNKPPILRQIFEFIDKVSGVEEEPIDRMKYFSKLKYLRFRKNVKKLPVEKTIIIPPRSEVELSARGLARQTPKNELMVSLGGLANDILRRTLKIRTKNAAVRAFTGVA